MTIPRNSMYASASMPANASMPNNTSMYANASMYAEQAPQLQSMMYTSQLFTGQSTSSYARSVATGIASGLRAGQPRSAQYATGNVYPHAQPAAVAAGPGAVGKRPLRVAHINAALIPAGIEYWLAALCRYANPSRLEFLRSVVLTDWVDQRQVARMGMPVEVGGRDSVVAAATECDVLLVSDPGRESQRVAEWINEARPALTVFVAHGDGDYTADRMSGIGAAVDHIVAVTQHVRRAVCSGWPVSVILNGVDPKRLMRTQPRHHSRDQLGFSPSDFVVGFVGRFSEEKRPELVIDAVARLPRHVKLLLVGHGHMREQLIEHCLAELPGRFCIVEGDGDLGDLYASMDTLVMPSQLEGYGLVAMEAMMSGVPVIGTPFGMIADLVTDGVDGLVVGLEPESIAAAIAKLGKSQELRRCLIAGGRRLAEQSGYAVTMAREYESLLWRLWSQQDLKPQLRI